MIAQVGELHLGVSLGFLAVGPEGVAFYLSLLTFATELTPLPGFKRIQGQGGDDWRLKSSGKGWYYSGYDYVRVGPGPAAQRGRAWSWSPGAAGAARLPCPAPALGALRGFARREARSLEAPLRPPRPGPEPGAGERVGKGCWEPLYRRRRLGKGLGAIG